MTEQKMTITTLWGQTIEINNIYDTVEEAQENGYKFSFNTIGYDVYECETWNGDEHDGYVLVPNEIEMDLVNLLNALCDIQCQTAFIVRYYKENGSEELYYGTAKEIAKQISYYDAATGYVTKVFNRIIEVKQD